MARKKKLEWDGPREAFMKLVGANLRTRRNEADNRNDLEIKEIVKK